MKYQAFPLLTISFIIFAALTFIKVSNADGVIWHEAEIIALPLYSGRDWMVSGGDIFNFFSMGLLFVELVRATGSDQMAIGNHLLSFMLFIVVLLFFILAPGFGNSTYFFFLLMALLDPMVGMVVSQATGKRDVHIGADGKKALLG